MRTDDIVKVKIKEICVGSIVRHFEYENLPENEKRRNSLTYRVISLDCMHTETYEELVIYQALYAPYRVFARPKSDFFSLVDKNEYPNIKQVIKFEKAN